MNVVKITLNRVPCSTFTKSKTNRSFVAIPSKTIIRLIMIERSPVPVAVRPNNFI